MHFSPAPGRFSTRRRTGCDHLPVPV